MKLELTHIKGYLDFDLVVMYRNKLSKIMRVDLFTKTYIQLMEFTHDSNCTIDKIKPVLRPLSDIEKYITVNGDEFVPFLRLERYGYYDRNCLDVNTVKSVSYNLMQYLLEWHFDVFDLISNNLAIDINTLK